MPIDWLPREARYVEKLATPDVTIADMIGDIDPIKAAQGGLQLGSELAMHFGLLPRANRGLFAINELPDLAGKIQVGLFNILQEGDVQIKGYPGPPAAGRDGALHRQPRGLHGARQDHHAAQGPHRRRDSHALHGEPRAGDGRSRRRKRGSSAGMPIEVPAFVREVVEEVAFQARNERKIDKRSGVSQRMPISVLESVVSNAERRAFVHGESPVVARVIDLYAALPSMTGKFELEYEGELKGAEHVARELIRARGVDGVRRLLPGRRRAAGGRVVRSRRHAESRRQRARRRTSSIRRGACRAWSSWRIAPASRPTRRCRCSRRASTSCSKASTRRRRSAAPTSAAITAPSRRGAASRQAVAAPVLTPDDDETDAQQGRKKKRYYN